MVSKFPAVLAAHPSAQRSIHEALKQRELRESAAVLVVDTVCAYVQTMHVDVAHLIAMYAVEADGLRMDAYRRHRVALVGYWNDADQKRCVALERKCAHAAQLRTDARLIGAHKPEAGSSSTSPSSFCLPPTEHSLPPGASAAAAAVAPRSRDAKSPSNPKSDTRGDKGAPFRGKRKSPSNPTSEWAATDSSNSAAAAAAAVNDDIVSPLKRTKLDDSPINAAKETPFDER
jgi:hypothetical protein